MGDVTLTKITDNEDFNICLTSSKSYHLIPKHIRENEDLNKAIEYSLPKNYDFEIHKSLWRIQQDGAKHVGLQFPEGLFHFATQICSILQYFNPYPIQVTILGDVTYGACCVDDIASRSIGIDLLIHYGHSCLIPVTQLSLKNCLYVFVEILFDYRFLIELIKQNFCLLPSEQNREKNPTHNNCHSVVQTFRDQEITTFEEKSCVALGFTPIALETILPPHRPLTVALMGTIQYSNVIFSVQKRLKDSHIHIVVPQNLPLTPGEVLGCTSPKLSDSVDLVIFIADGRFHLESVMIQNPGVLFFRYDPFLKRLFRERYDHQTLHNNRQAAIAKAKEATHVGLILGTLGRQGSIGLFERLIELVTKKGIRITPFLMSEISPDRLKSLSKFSAINVFIQVSCPRLSLDWGHCIDHIALLTPYEAFVAFSDQEYQTTYPMDYYSKTGGPWTNFAQQHRQGSLASKISCDTPFSDLQQRRELIRKRAEARKAAQSRS